jgi:serine/threonine protein kinase
MTLEELIDERLAGNNPAVPADLAHDFRKAIAGDAALRDVVNETGAWPNAADRAPPELPDDYEIVRELGRGGMGVVYLGRQTMMDRQVAIKVINKALLDHPDALARFHREVKAAAQLTHPNIVVAYDAGQADGTHYFAMEYVDGVDMSKLVKERGPLPVPEACGYVRQAALGLQHAHEKGLVHRDIKPGNLLIAADGSPKLLDFGIGKALDVLPASAQDVRTIVLPMTPEYASPEQLHGEPVTTASDVYSLGVVLFELVTGALPHPAGGALPDVVRAITEVEMMTLDREAFRELLSESERTSQEIAAVISERLAAL